MLTFLTRETFEAVAARYPGGHWDCTPLADRWDYHEQALGVVQSLPLKHPADVLEMGTMGAALVEGSDTLDFSERWNFPGKQPTHNHDARRMPWPIAEGRYEIFVALRVFQHLAPVQKECFREARRIARRVLIVVPDTYQTAAFPESRGITLAQFTDWNGGVSPTVCRPTRMGVLYYWDTDAAGHAAGVGRAFRRLGNRVAAATRGLIRMAKGAARSGLRVLGYEVRRLPGATVRERAGCDRPEGPRAAAGGSGGPSCLVEFIGPSGIGKTTVFDAVIRNLKPGDRVLTYEQAVRGMAPVEVPVVAVPESYEKLLRAKLRRAAESTASAVATTGLLAYCHRMLLKELRLAGAPLSAHVLLDEGLCHNFCDALVDMGADDPEAFGALVRARAVIHCVADPALVADRVRSRERSGRRMVLHGGLGDEAMRQFNERVLALREALVGLLRHRGIPCLDLNMGEAVETNALRVLGFLRDLNRGAGRPDVGVSGSAAKEAS